MRRILELLTGGNTRQHDAALDARTRAERRFNDAVSTQELTITEIRDEMARTVNEAIRRVG